MNWYIVQACSGFEKKVVQTIKEELKKNKLEDNLGELMLGEENNWNLTPSFGFGYYDDGDGKKLGNEIEFRTTLEISYQLKNSDRVGISFGHISNANIGDKNPGVEIINLSYQKPF